MNSVLIVGLGGFLGSIARYLVSAGTQNFFDGSTRIPLATLIVNILGSFFIGVLFQYLGEEQARYSALKLFFATGVLGGFTTFSAFSLETALLLRQGSEFLALLNMATQVIFGILAVLAGFFSAKAFL